MQNSSALERLIQIVQLLHTLKFKDSSIRFDVSNGQKTGEAIVAMTIAEMRSKRGSNTTTLSMPNPNIIAMAGYNFAVAWRKHRPKISIGPDDSNPDSGKDNRRLLKKMLLDLLDQFNKNPFHIRAEKISNRILKQINRQLRNTWKQLIETLKRTMKVIL